MLSISTAIAFFIRAALDPCDRHLEVSDKKRVQSQSVPRIATKSSPLSFMKSKLVLLVSHELSLSGIYIYIYFILLVSSVVLVALVLWFVQLK